MNTEERYITFKLTGVEAPGSMFWNEGVECKYEILDDERIHGAWELDHEDPAAFRQLFGLVSGDIANLESDDVEKIEIEFEYAEVKVIIELKELETIDECGTQEESNKVIEIEASLEDLTTLAADGDIEFTGEVEQADGSVLEFVYTGQFAIINDLLRLTLSGEFDDAEAAETTLELTR